MSIADSILLWAFVALGGLVIYKRYMINRPIDKNSAVISGKVYNILLALVAIVAVFVRVYKFGAVPGGFNQDGAMAAVDGKALADYATDRYGMYMPVHLTAWGYGQMSSLLSYLIALFVKFFGLSPITARLPLLLTSIAALVCLYLFVKDTFGKNAALAVAFFAAINPWHILQSRWTLDCNLYPQFFMMGIYFLNKGLNKRIHLVISMIMFGLCMYCYGISIYTMPVFLLATSIYLAVTKKIKMKDIFLAAGVYLLIAWPFILTMAINFFKIDTITLPFCTIPYFKDSVRSNDILFFSKDFFGQLGQNFTSLMNTTLLQKKDLPWNDIEGFGTMYLFSIPFVILGVVTLFKEYRKNTGAALALIFLFTGIWCGLTTNGVNINRINIVYFPMIIMAGIGIFTAIKTMRYLNWGVMAVYAISFVMFLTTYFTSYADSISVYFFKDFGDAVLSLKDSDAEKLYITADSQYEGAVAVSEILTLFYHDIDAKYYQGEIADGEIPFNEKYEFNSIRNIKIDPAENAEYVVRINDLVFFEPDKFTAKRFGNFCTVSPK